MPPDPLFCGLLAVLQTAVLAAIPDKQPWVSRIERFKHSGNLNLLLTHGSGCTQAVDFRTIKLQAFTEDLISVLAQSGRPGCDSGVGLTEFGRQVLDQKLAQWLCADR